jgi:hypothetical protein
MNILMFSLFYGIYLCSIFILPVSLKRIKLWWFFEKKKIHYNFLNVDFRTEADVVDINIIFTFFNWLNTDLKNFNHIHRNFCLILISSG